jgi:hypothetical protein
MSNFRTAQHAYEMQDDPNLEDQDEPSSDSLEAAETYYMDDPAGIEEFETDSEKVYLSREELLDAFKESKQAAIRALAYKYDSQRVEDCDE